MVIISFILSLALYQDLSGTALQDGKELFDQARRYETGQDTAERAPDKSFALYRRSALAGYAPAQNYLGFLYYGRTEDRNIDSALYWIEKAALAGDITAAGNLGYLLSQAPDIPHDYTKAVKWLEIAADKGLPAAFIPLADMKRRGEGTETDTTAAVVLYEKAMKAGVPDAQYLLRDMMKEKWQRLPGDSALHLGQKYYFGGGVAAAIPLLKRATEDKEPLAFTIMGDAYSKGLGVIYDYPEAIRMYLTGALLGQPSAQFILAETLDFFPDAVTEDDLKEILGKESCNFDLTLLLTPQYWYEKAAEKGITDADSAFRNLLPQ